MTIFVISHKAKYSDVDIQFGKSKMIEQIHQQHLTEVGFKRKGVSLFAFCPINCDTGRQGHNTSNVTPLNVGNESEEYLKTGMLFTFNYENLTKMLSETVPNASGTTKSDDNTPAYHDDYIEKMIHAVRLECLSFILDCVIQDDGELYRMTRHIRAEFDCILETWCGPR